MSVLVPTKPGELHQLGRNRLLCGDSISAADVERLLAGERARLLLTSPPYLDAREYGGHDVSLERITSFIEVWEPHVDLMLVNLGIIRRDKAVVRYWDAYINAAERAGLRLLSWNVWDRGSAGSVVQATAMFPIEHEFVFVFGRDPFDLNKTVPNKTAGASARSGVRTIREQDGTMAPRKRRETLSHRALGTVLRVPQERSRGNSAPFSGGLTSRDHPAPYPIRFARAYVEAVTQPRDLVVDPFGGSGTTMIATAQAGRRAATMEIEPSYCDGIRERWSKYTAGDERAIA